MHRCTEEKPEWTKNEVAQMLHHLKERGQWHAFNLYPLEFIYKILGMSSFIKEYVVQRNIAIPRLLEALGVSLVGPLYIISFWLLLTAVWQCPELRNVRSSTLLYFLKVAMSHQ
jgi:NAD-dependent histone deacetylase SIR2